MTTESYTLPGVPSVDQVGVEERADRFRQRSIKKKSKVDGLKHIISMLDLTTLAGKDTPGKVRRLCGKALNPLPDDVDCPSTAAVCVYPRMVSTAVDETTGSDVNVASVASYFPSGQVSLEQKLDDVGQAVQAGADEVDIVINRGAFLKGDYLEVYREIEQAREAAGDTHLKVILETGELETYDNIRLASRIAIDGGADFIKTSTGTTEPAATMSVTLVMLHAIRDHYFRSGEKVGMKPAGGIRRAKEALRYLAMVNETLGSDWLSPGKFRFGASSLLNDLLMQLKKEDVGRYYSGRYLSLG
ncbi:MAG: deoxyribose-phosphate aldolase [bacterium]